MKTTATLAILSLFTMASCNREECHECHYDGLNGEVELGEQCGEDLENLEAAGYTDSTSHYEVHCHEH